MALWRLVTVISLSLVIGVPYFGTLPESTLISFLPEKGSM